MSQTVLVTVGSTKFDELIRAVDSQPFADELVAQGYNKLIMQVGAGSHIPCQIVPKGQNSGTYSHGLSVEYFDFAPSLAQYMESAALIISHAGSGSVFEALRLRKPLIAVPNPILMANHQAELAEHLEAMGHLISATPATLVDALRQLKVTKLVPYEKGRPQGIVAAIDKLMGFADS
ncbi:probable bifunctional UDP-N-acetylglucosamine transferase [Coccomyxa sp. Obi]|nr:probable bifunctional UDP-N-acetylglucosamine transferase [Coccomyxa sp. Obi]